MSTAIRISYTSALILKAIASGLPFGFQMMEVTGLPSGTVYPALRRLEKAELVLSSWEPVGQAAIAGRPARRLYQLTTAGIESLGIVSQRYRLPALESAVTKAGAPSVSP